MMANNQHYLKSKTADGGRPVTSTRWRCGCGSELWVDCSYAVCLRTDEIIGYAY